MGLIGTAIGGIGSIAGGLASAAAMRNVKRNLEAQKKDNQEWYDRRYNEDATQRADAQRILTLTEENIKKRNQQAAGAAAVMGGTEESVAAAKAENAKAMADAASTIAVNADARKDQIEQQYQARDASLNAQLNQMEKDKADAITKAAQGVGDAAGKMPF